MKLLLDSNFNKAVEIVLEHEGGFSNHPADRGGVTKYGISLRFLKTLPDGDINDDGETTQEDIQHLTRDQAVAFYWREFWNKEGYGRFSDPILAAKILDLSVNMGARRAHILLQRALRSVAAKVVEDGKLGAITLKAVAHAPRDALLAALRSEAAGYYRLIAQLNPSQEQFLQGWLRRAYT